MIKNYLSYAVAAAFFVASGIGNVALAETELEGAGTAGTNDSLATAQPLVFTDKVEVTGTIGGAYKSTTPVPMSDIDFYWFQGRRGEVVRIDIDGGMKASGDLRSLDSLIAIFDQDGMVLKQKNDLNILGGEAVDDGSRSSFDPWIEKILLPANGRYYVGVTSDASYAPTTPGGQRTLRVFLDGGGTEGATGNGGFVGGSVSNGTYTLVVERTPAPTLQIGIEIKPNARSITTHANSPGKIPVRLKTSEEFNALNADQHTIKFGPPNRPGTIGRCNKNGNDLLCHFDKHDAGFSDGDTEGVVSGTIDGKPFEGSAWLKVIPVTKDKKD
jgi:hypothetical protein